MMDIQKVINPQDYEVGVIVARFQTHELHSAHKEMIDIVCDNHKKVIIFLGVSRITDTRRNPLDFATRAAMIQKEYPQVIVLPQNDQRSDTVWSKFLDAQIPTPYGHRTTLLYGSRDSFLPHYKGKYATTELTADTFISGTEIRNNVSKEILESRDFRAGIIHANFARRPVTYSTVDVAIYNDEGQILLAKKPYESVWRFVGGFVDRTDISDERAAYREVLEETGGCHVSNIKYILSHQVDDWRYRNEDDGIMTRLFIASFGHGRPTPTDDISELKWFDISYFTEGRRIKNDIMEEHQEMMTILIERVYKEQLIPNLGEFYEVPTVRIDPDVLVKDTTFIPK
jgi:bifunctional NMN adenylyltransferase/nudix hydrolase